MRSKQTLETINERLRKLKHEEIKIKIALSKNKKQIRKLKARL